MNWQHCSNNAQKSLEARRGSVIVPKLRDEVPLEVHVEVKEVKQGGVAIAAKYSPSINYYRFQSWQVRCSSSCQERSILVRTKDTEHVTYRQSFLYQNRYYVQYSRNADNLPVPLYS